MPRYMPQHVFEMAVSAVTAAYYTIGTSRVEVASDIWSGYADLLADDPDQVVADIVGTSEASADILERMSSSPAAVREDVPGFIRHFMWFCRTFDDSGRRRRFRVFGGVRFTAARTPQADRKARYLAKLGLYRMAMHAGTAPLAPRGWSSL